MLKGVIVIADGSERPDDPKQYQEDLDVLLKVGGQWPPDDRSLIILEQTTAPRSADPIRIIQPSANALGPAMSLSRFGVMLSFSLVVRMQAGFVKAEAIVNMEIPFIVELYASENVQFENLRFDSLRVEFSDGKTCQVDHSEAMETPGWSDLGEVGTDGRIIQADLSFRPGEVKLFRGTVRSGETGPLQVSLLVLHVSQAYVLAASSANRLLLLYEILGLSI